MVYQPPVSEEEVAKSLPTVLLSIVDGYVRGTSEDDKRYYDRVAIDNHTYLQYKQGDSRIPLLIIDINQSFLTTLKGTGLKGTGAFGIRQRPHTSGLHPCCSFVYDLGYDEPRSKVFKLTFTPNDEGVLVITKNIRNGISKVVYSGTLDHALEYFRGCASGQ